MSDPSWTVFPAIDLHAGRVVRLRQGDLQQATVYSDEPESVALRWQKCGAHWVHVVDLDGAFGQESRSNWQALRRIVATGLQVQFGGGARDLAAMIR
ncbi:MAG: HisA/HisF-related TIM barrel protein, partial [Chloroflexia bacterium]